jgi:hypothetical protein
MYHVNGEITAVTLKRGVQLEQAFTHEMKYDYNLSFPETALQCKVKIKLPNGKPQTKY